MQVRQDGAPNLYEVESESDPGKWYQVFANGTEIKCNCKGYLAHKACKHVERIKTYLQEREGDNDEEEEPGAPLQGSISLSKWTKRIHGKDFIQYEGLLAMAHEQGLTELHAEFISVDDKLALAFAFATFKDGRKFYESGDATPKNVNVNVKAHYARCALTRAKARCLRDALNIGTVSVEEIDEAI